MQLNDIIDINILSMMNCICEIYHMNNLSQIL